MSLADFELNHPVEFMRLTLTYKGMLHAQSNSGGRASEKHAIRRQFHIQMLEVWRTHPALHDYHRNWSQWTEEQQNKNDPNVPIHCFNLGAFRFVPLVTNHLATICELDILFLRHEPVGHIVDSESGDIDNRIKVLFDALRMPLKREELPPAAQPDVTERPFYCLLENDSLITAFRLESERLLYPPTVSEAEVQLTIHVTVKVTRFTHMASMFVD
jgi:hypothetical protein